MAAICVFCASSEHIDPSYLQLAEDVGRRIGTGGHSLVSGGGRVSMMGAVTTAARAAGAHTLGVIPRHLVGYEVADADADELRVVDTMRQRKALMDEAADAFLVLPGGIGTLEEFFEVWTSASLGMHVKPVLVLDPSGFFTPLWSWLQTLQDGGFVQPAAVQRLVRVTDVPAAFEVLDALPHAGRVAPGSGSNPAHV